jgi:hypothetical protein
MKYNLRLIFTFVLAILSSNINSLKLTTNDIPPRHFVVDRTSNPSLHHVIRRNPTVTVQTHMSPIIASTADNSVMSFGNNNDNNGPNVPSPTYGKSPEIAGPAIYVHSKGNLSVIQETPAHVGWRNEQKVITSLNKATSKIKMIIIIK